MSRRAKVRTIEEPRLPLRAGGIVAALLVAAACWLAFNRKPRPPAPDSEKAAGLRITAEGLVSAGRLAEALDVLNQAEKANPAQTETYLLQARILGQMYRLEEAQARLAVAHRIAPSDPDVTLAMLRARPVFYSPETEALARKALEQSPASAEARYLLGMSIAASEDPRRLPEAISLFAEAAKLEPAWPTPRIEAGKASSRSGHDSQALRFLETAIDLLDHKHVRGPVSPAMLDAWVKQRRIAAFWLAQVYRRMGRTDRVKAAARDAAEFGDISQRLRVLRDRANASPPDLSARGRLESLAQAGIDDLVRKRAVQQ